VLVCAPSNVAVDENNKAKLEQVTRDVKTIKESNWCHRHRRKVDSSILLASGMTRGGPSYSCKAGVLDYGRKIETESAFSNVDRFGAGGASMFLEQLRDNFLILQAFIASMACYNFPLLANVPLWNSKGYIIALLLHIALSEPLYYWIHKMFHRDYLFYQLSYSPPFLRSASILLQFSRVALNERFSFFGNVSLGSSVSLSELREMYHVVRYCFDET
ncbi:hypothetical protein FRX31_012292, partial [Thalictrum thalictroides]